MPSNRMGKVNETMLRELSAQIRAVKDPGLKDAIISVIRVEASNDLRTAKAYISVMGGDERGVLDGLRRASGFIGRGLGQNIRLHHTPKIEFILDKSIAHGANINRILEGLGELCDDDDRGKDSP